MLFSNALLFTIASTVVSAALEVQLPENWVAVEKREGSPRLNKLFARLAKRNANASDSSKVPPGVTYTYVDPTTTVTITGGVTPTPKPTTTILPTTITSSSTKDNGAIETSTEVVASSCDDNGSCTTTTFVVGYTTQV